MGGVKVGRSPASLPLQVTVERLRPPEDFLVSLEQHLLLVYTGKTRLARNLLQVRGLRQCLVSLSAKLTAVLHSARRSTWYHHGVSCLQDVVRSWYSRLPAMVQNVQQLVANSEECAAACSDGDSVFHFILVKT